MRTKRVASRALSYGKERPGVATDEGSALIDSFSTLKESEKKPPPVASDSRGAEKEELLKQETARFV